MKRLLVTALLAAGCAGYASPGEDVANDTLTAIKFVHDNKRAVGCWYAVGQNGQSIACLPDAAYNYVPEDRSKP